MWFFMVGVPCRRENLSHGENRALFYQPVQGLQHFSKKSKMADVFENLRVFPTIDFWRFLWTCSGDVVEHVPEEKRCHFFFLFSAKFWLNMTVLYSYCFGNRTSFLYWSKRGSRKVVAGHFLNFWSNLRFEMWKIFGKVWSFFSTLQNANST